MNATSKYVYSSLSSEHNFSEKSALFQPDKHDSGIWGFQPERFSRQKHQIFGPANGGVGTDHNDRHELVYSFGLYP